MDYEANAVWRPYGLSGNPFFTNPLESVSDVDRGIHLFRGEERRKDGERLFQRILNSDNSVRLIEGPNGIGKTTLANYIKYRLQQQDGTAVYPDVIRLNPGHDRPVEAFVAAILHGAIGAIRTMDHADAQGEMEHAGEGLVLDELVDVHSKTLGIQQIINANITRGQILREAEHRPLAEWFDAVRNVGTSAQASNIDRIVLHLNNIDQAVLTDAKATADLFGQARDILQVPGFHFLLCANEQFRLRALADRQNVTDILGNPLRPEPLEAGDVHEIMEARYEDLQILNAGLTFPMDPAEVARLHDRFGGELRAALEMIGQVFIEEIGPTGHAQPLTSDQVMEIQKPLILDLLSTLPDSQLQLLQTVARLTAEGEDEVRQHILVDDLSRIDATRFQQGAVSQLADALVAGNWLVKSRPHQRATYYRLGGRAYVVREELLEQ